MSAGFPQLVLVGTTPGDGTGDPAPIPFQKYNATVADIYNTLAGSGLSAPGYLSVGLTAALTHDLNPGAAWPGIIGFLDFTVTANNATVDGIVNPGSWKQCVFRCHPESTYNLILGITGSGSQPANQFQGAGASMTLPPGFRTVAFWLPGPNAWSIG